MTIRLFRFILTICWITECGAIIAALMAHRVLPPELWPYLSSQMHKPLMWNNYIVLIMSFTSLLASFVSYIGLYFWKTWARTLFMLVVIAGFLIQALSTNPVVFSALVNMFYSTNCFFTGLLIGCMFFCPEIKGKIERTG